MGGVPSGVNLRKILHVLHIYNTNLHVDTQEASKYNKNSDRNLLRRWGIQRFWRMTERRKKENRKRTKKLKGDEIPYAVESS